MPGEVEGGQSDCVRERSTGCGGRSEGKREIGEGLSEPERQQGGGK